MSVSAVANSNLASLAQLSRQSGAAPATLSSGTRVTAAADDAVKTSAPAGAPVPSFPAPLLNPATGFAASDLSNLKIVQNLPPVEDTAKLVQALLREG